MRIWIIVGILILGLIYLNRAYSHIYTVIGDNHLLPPTLKNTYIISGNLTTPKHIKYVAIGDSLTAGVGSTSFENILAYQIAGGRKNQASSITLVNLARPGDTTREVIAHQLQSAIEENPDFISVLIGVNDIHDFVSISEFEKNYSMILDRLSSETKAKITVINIPFIGSNLLLYPPLNIYFNLKTRQYNSIIKKICQERNIKYVDLYSKSNLNQDSKYYYAADQFHPSDEGYKLWGKLINED